MLRFATAAVAVVATALTGCGSGKQNPTVEQLAAAATSIAAAATNAPGHTPRQVPSAAAGAPDSIAPKGKATIIIDGEVSGLTGPVDCGEADYSAYIMIGDKPREALAIVNLEHGDIEAVAILIGSVNILVDDEFGGSATVTEKAGNYVIKGDGQKIDMKNIEAGIKSVPFTIDTTCPDE